MQEGGGAIARLWILRLSFHSADLSLSDSHHLK